MSRTPDPYETLGVTRQATAAEIRAAYRRLARASHPDHHENDPQAERAFKRISRAYETLGDAKRRRAYDLRLTSGRFAAPGGGGQASFRLDTGPLYHSDLGHHSDFYQAGDPLTVSEAAALVGRDPSWLRRAIRHDRLPAARGTRGYLLRRRDVERLDRTTPRHIPRSAEEPTTSTNTASEMT